MVIEETFCDCTVISLVKLFVIINKTAILDPFMQSELLDIVQFDFDKTTTSFAIYATLIMKIKVEIIMQLCYTPYANLIYLFFFEQRIYGIINAVLKRTLISYEWSLFCVYFNGHILFDVRFLFEKLKVLSFIAWSHPQIPFITWLILWQLSIHDERKISCVFI